jgi:hypothetical protein
LIQGSKKLPGFTAGLLSVTGLVVAAEVVNLFFRWAADDPVLSVCDWSRHQIGYPIKGSQ